MEVPSYGITHYHGVVNSNNQTINQSINQPLLGVSERT